MCETRYNIFTHSHILPGDLQTLNYPGSVHCDNCEKCGLPHKVCRPVADMGCHLCGKLTHKRRDCPLKREKHHSAWRKTNHVINEESQHSPKECSKTADKKTKFTVFHNRSSHRKCHSLQRYAKKNN